MKTLFRAFLVLLPAVALADSSPTTIKPVTTTTAPANIPDPTQELQVMTERLKLSAGQQAAIKPILVAEYDRRKTIEGNPGLSAQQKHDNVGTVHRAALQQIKAIFTPQQLAQIEQEQDHPSPSSTSADSAHSK